jgi:hypothetical protein
MSVSLNEGSGEKIRGNYDQRTIKSRPGGGAMPPAGRSAFEQVKVPTNRLQRRALAKKRGRAWK